jgi:hypothetical protein
MQSARQRARIYETSIGYESMEAGCRNYDELAHRIGAIAAPLTARTVGIE